MLRKSFTLVAIGLVSCPPAMADGFYVGASTGLTQIEEEEVGGSIDDKPFGWRLIVGYEFSENFAFEGAYVNSGEADGTVRLLGINGGADTPVKAEVTAITLSLVGMLPIGNAADVFGKIGYYDGEQEVSAFAASFDVGESGFTAGFGARLDLPNNFAIRGDIDWFDTDLDSLWSIGIGVQYRFGK